MNRFPKISVIIPVRPNEEFKNVLNGLKKISYPKDLIEVFISFGYSPSLQRNKAAKKAKGEILYFLDSDAEVEKAAFKRVVDIFLDKKIKFKNNKSRGFSLMPGFMSSYIIKKFFSGTVYNSEIGVVGGALLPSKKELLWQEISRGILESFFAHFLMAARYRPIGLVHRSSEKELILGNLAVKKEIFQKLGGLNHLLYPNEENEFLNRIEKNGFQLIYHPGVIAFRPHRKTFFEILKTFFNYGRGRMEQVRIEGPFINFVFFTPFFFSLYLFILLFFHPVWFFTPFFVYISLGYVSSLGFALRNKKIIPGIILPWVFLFSHVSYALGTVKGAFVSFKKKKRKNEKIEVKKIKSFGLDWKS